LEHGCEAISGNFALLARNCLTSTFKNIVMQMRKVNCEKGYFNGDRPLSRGGHVESLENKKLCFCASRLVFKFFTARLHVKNVLLLC